MIIGCPSSGKTTLAKEISKKLNLPLIHLDVLGWRGNRETVMYVRIYYFGGLHNGKVHL